jgi:S1 RNA binding domain protein
MQPEVGAVLEGKVSGVTKFGAFVNLPGGKSGLVHISEIANTFVSDVAQYVSVGQTVKVKVIGINGDKINLSIKRAEESEEAPRRRVPQQRSEQQSRPPKQPQQPQQPSGQVAAPTEDQAFEDKLKQFMKDSDSRIADNRMYADRGRSRRRK